MDSNIKTMRKLILFVFLLVGIGLQAQYNLVVDTLFLDNNDDTLFRIRYDGSNLILNQHTIPLAAGTGDMTKAVYDPQTIEGDAFARASMTVTQAQIGRAHV